MIEHAPTQADSELRFAASAPVTPADLARTLKNTARENLWIIALGLSLIYTATAVSHALVLSSPHRGPLTAVAAISAALLLVLVWWLRRVSIADWWVYKIGASIALTALFNEVLQQQLLLNPSHQIYTSIFILAIGVFMLSTTGLLVCTSLALAAWGVSVWRAEGDAQMVEWIYAHLTCATLALTFHFMRLRTLGRMESLRLAEANRTADLQRALAELRASESLFRQFADHSGQVFWINDGLTHQVAYVNRVYETLIGRTIEQLREDPLDWIGAIHPDDRLRIMSAYLSSQEGGNFEEEYRIVRPDGTIRWVHDHGFVIGDESGSVRRNGGTMRDITDRVLAQGELIRSEQANRAILHAIPDMIIRIARDGTFLSVQNPKNFQALWLTSQDVGSQISKVLPPELARIGQQQIEAALTTRQVQSHEYVWPMDGQDHWREWRIVPVSEEEVMVIVRDITARKQAEEALRTSRQRLSDLIADIDGIVWECDPRSFCFTYVSARAQKILGYPQEDWLKDENFFTRILHPDDRDRIIKFCAQRTVQRLDHEMDYRVIAADGRMLWMHDKVRVVKDEHGHTVRLCGLLIDITDSMRAAQALRDSERVLAKAQEIASLGSWIWEAASDCVTWSPQMYRIYDIKPQKFDGSWAKAFEMIHPDDQARVWQMAQKSLASGDVEAIEFRILQPDGVERIVTADAQIEYSAQGELNRIIGTVQDVTEVRKAQAQRQRLEGELKQAQKLEAVGTLATGVAHDFNNLLTAIRGYVDLTRASLDDEAKTNQALDMIALATEQAAGVTHSLLTFGHRTPTEKGPIDLAPNIRESLQLLRRLLPASIELVEDLPEDDALFATANGHQLQQVWLNLTLNARDAMPVGGKLIIRLRRLSQGPQSPQDSWHGQPLETALITVSDNGTGMSEKVMQRIFEPYFTTKQRGQGTGLGLSIVHGIITDHGGRIRVQSESGKGTRFIIQLPTCAPPVSDLSSASASNLQRGTGQIILLAEDNEFVREVIASSLMSAGYRIVQAADGEEAMHLYQEHQHDLGLLLLNTDLPKLSGEVCLERIRESSPALPAILMSASLPQQTSSPDRPDELRLAKPFQIARLIELVEQIFLDSQTEESDKTRP